MGTVEARQCLYCLDAGEGLIDIHRVEEGLVISSLELIGTDQEAVGVVLDLFSNIAAREAIERRFSDFPAAIFVLARKGDDRLVGLFAPRGMF